MKPLPCRWSALGEVLNIEWKTRRSQKNSFQKVLKISQIFQLSGHCILKNAILSIGCYSIMGQNMGQTVFRKIADFYSELFNHQSTRKSPEILRFQDFLWLRRQDSNFKFVKHLEYSVHFRILISFF